MTRIIVIDDDRNICDLVQYRLTTMGMDVDAFFDGERGLEAIVEDPPDLAIVDMLMPKMNGLEVTLGVRDNPATKDLPIVLFTALDKPEFEEAGRAAGAEYYLVKPFSVLALGAYMEEILGLRTCIVCGKTRNVDDVEYSPDQEPQGIPVGWTVTVDGDICGECRPEFLDRRKA
jgi:two-component system response regulator MtrA